MDANATLDRLGGLLFSMRVWILSSAGLLRESQRKTQRQEQRHAPLRRHGKEESRPTEQKVRLTIRLEAQALAHEIELRFVRTGKIELPEGQIEAPAKSTS